MHNIIPSAAAESASLCQSLPLSPLPPCLIQSIPSHPTHTFASSLSIPIPFRSLPTTPIPSSSSLFNISTRADEVQRRMMDGGGSGGVLRLPVSQVLAPSTLLVLTVPMSLLPHFAFSNYLHLSPPFSPRTHPIPFHHHLVPSMPIPSPTVTSLSPIRSLVIFTLYLRSRSRNSWFSLLHTLECVKALKGGRRQGESVREEG